MKEQELKEKIAEYLASYAPSKPEDNISELAKTTPFPEMASDILALLKEAGWVQLAPDQTLPIGLYSHHTVLGETSIQAQQMLLDAGRRKVKP